jgi:regulator of sirC expression with transglutaminase-like and TPR domain
LPDSMKYWSLARESFQKAISYPDEEIDLAYAALCIAQAHTPTLDPQRYLDRLEDWAQELAQQLPTERYPLKVLKALNEYIYDHLGFRGNINDYYDPCNSFFDQVLDRRLGIPITLSLLYLELAKRVGFPMQGIGMPGHFVMRPCVDDMDVYVDAFHRGELLFAQDCQERLENIYGQPVVLQSEHLSPVSNSQFLARLLNNLKAIYINRREPIQALGTIDGILLLFPHWWSERRDRGLILYELRLWEEARQDLQAYIQANPEAPDTIVIQQLLRQMAKDP